MKHTANSTFDILLLGAGPANMMLALELISKNAHCSLAIVEQGPSSSSRHCRASHSRGCRHCVSCDVVNGFGGAGMFSDGKLHRSDDDYASRVFSYLEQFGLPTFVSDEYHSQLEQTHNNLQSYGFTFSGYVSQHVGTDCIINVTRQIESFVKSSGVTLLFSKKATSVRREAQAYLVTCNDPTGKQYTYSARRLIVGTGKTSAANFQTIFSDLPVKRVAVRPSPGIRFEFPTRAIHKLTGYVIKDPQIALQTSSGAILSTFCTCDGGQVVPFLSSTGLQLGGQSASVNRTDRSNFAILQRTTGQENKSPEVLENEQKTYSQFINMKINKPLLQTLGDFLGNSLRDKKHFHKTTLEYYEYANLNSILPANFAAELPEFIERLGHVDSEFSNRNNILSAPVVEYSVPMIEVTDYVISAYTNLYFVGDITGYASGIISSGIMGLLAADNILENTQRIARDQ